MGRRTKKKFSLNFKKNYNIILKFSLNFKKNYNIILNYILSFKSFEFFKDNKKKVGRGNTL